MAIGGYDMSNPYYEGLNTAMTDAQLAAQASSPVPTTGIAEALGAQQAWLDANVTDTSNTWYDATSAGARANAIAAGNDPALYDWFNTNFNDPNLYFDRYGNYIGGIQPWGDAARQAGDSSTAQGAAAAITGNGLGVPLPVLNVLTQIPNWKTEYLNEINAIGYASNQDDYARGAGVNTAIANVLARHGFADAAAMAQQAGAAGGQAAMQGRELDRKLQDTGPMNMAAGGGGDALLMAAKAMVAAGIGSAVAGAGMFSGLGADAAAGGAMDMGIGFGGDTLSAIGLAEPGVMSQIGTQFANAFTPDALAGRFASGAFNQLGNPDFDFGQLATGTLTGAANSGLSGAANVALGGWDGFQLPDFGGEPPVGYMSEMDLGGFADMAPAPSTGGWNLDALQRADEALLAQGALAAGVDMGPGYDLNALAGLDTGAMNYLGGTPSFAGGPDVSGAGLGAANGEWDALPEEQAAPQDVEQTEEVFDKPADEKGFSIKPSTIVSVAKALYGLLGEEGKSQEKALKKVVEREYANEEERSAAYYAYAQELLGYVPSVSEAYALDPQNVNTQFGNTFVDPETGEVRYELTPGTQEYFDALMAKSKETLDAGLGLDTDQLSADQLEKAIASLQGKRDKDMATLTRALYARGLLGLVTYQGAGTNLLTGETESWSLDEGQGANPYFAAEMARRERENYELAKMSQGEAENFMTKLLNHSGGLLGKARDVDQQMIEALFQSGELTDEKGNVNRKKGKGLFDLVAGPGGAFMQQLMGSLPSGKAAAALADADMIEQLQRQEAIRRFMEEQGL